jgi:hypothetical protein
MRRFATVLACAIALVACGDNRVAPIDDAAVIPDATPVLRTPVDLPDGELALQALQILGANVGGAETRCDACHGLTRQRIRYWRALTDVATTTCFADSSLPSQAAARTTIDCMRSMPDVAGSDFAARKLGIYAAAAHLPWFSLAFETAGADAAEHDAFLARVQMPPAGGPEPMTQPQFDIVAEWFARGVPQLDETLPLDPPPDTCTPGISAAVAAHVTAMKQSGWRAINRGNGMSMHGCGAATDPRDCLQSAPLAVDQAYGAGWEVQGHGHLRVLHDATYATSYWTRTSADGRFVAHGVDAVAGSYVIDLQRDVVVPIAADYDPAFFPDNSGFAFQGSNRNMCGISVLTSNPSSVTMTEAACTRILALEQYEALGRFLGGGDFFGLDGQFIGDDGGKVPTTVDPVAAFTSTSLLSFTPMMFDGLTFDEAPPVRVAAPFEGDAVMSPSATLAVTRVAGPGDQQLGYVLRRVDATLIGSTYAIAAPEIARYCIAGAKPAFSFDERWLVYHHYETTGAANLYLLDLTTGVTVAITNMSPGQYALYPHFRSDGWIYAQVRDLNTGHEITIASDAALVAETAP